MLAVVLGTGCIAVTYPGPRRRESEVAMISAEQIRIRGVDDIDLGEDGKTRVEVLPGNRTVYYKLATARNYIVYMEILRSDLDSICINAKAGGNYVLKPIIEGNRWHAWVADGNTGEPAQHALCGSQ